MHCNPLHIWNLQAINMNLVLQRKIFVAVTQQVVINCECYV